jgi:nucleoside-diphosphate-sugar epimerase
VRILVQGAAGFLGRHLVDHLLASGHEVDGWTRQTADLRDRRNFADKRGPWDAAVHLAGHAVPGPTWNPAWKRENVEIAMNVFEHIADVSPGIRVVFASSARVYADRSEPHREDEPLAPSTEYGLSKKDAEESARRFSRELDIQIVRPFQQIGPSMPKGLLLPELQDRLSAGTGPIEMRGPDNTIDVVDVRDGVRGIAALLTVDAPSGEAWNLSSGLPRRVSELARGLCARLEIDREVRFATGATSSLVGNPAKLQAASGWTRVRSLDDTLDWITWPEENA